MIPGGSGSIPTSPLCIFSSHATTWTWKLPVKTWPQRLMRSAPPAFAIAAGSVP